jgi:hypothetical protein
MRTRADQKTNVPAIVIGLVTLAGAVVFALVVPCPKPFQTHVFAVITGVGAAAITPLINGVLTIRTKWLTAGGPLAVFVFATYVILQALPAMSR